MIRTNRLPTAFLILCLFCAQAKAQKISFGAPGIGDQDISKNSAPRRISEAKNSMPPDVAQLMQLLKMKDTVDRLRTKHSQQAPNNADLLETIMLRQKLVRAIQYASLELEEALANIEGDLAATNMQYAFFSAKRDKFLLLNNVATFVGSGTLGVLDSSSGIKLGAPTPNIFGITGNSISVGLPLLGLMPPKYKNPRWDHIEGNTLAPLFGRPYTGDSYDPIIWSYLEMVPAESKSNLTRRQTLLNNWEKYHGLSNSDSRSKAFIDALTNTGSQPDKISPSLLKTRAELLVELRSLIQQMYRDISNFSTETADL